MKPIIPDLSIVIPACNEQNRIRPTLDGYLGYYENSGKANVEILVVVNGSTDQTERIVGDYTAAHPMLRMLVIRERVGKGGALLRGLKEAAGSRVGFVDADGATSPQEFRRLADCLGEAGVVIGSRWMPGARISRPQGFSRRVASRLFNLMVRMLFGLRIHDTQCGAKIFKREVLDVILPVLGVSHWVFDVDLLYQVKRAGYIIREEPTVWNDVEGSKVRFLATLVDVPYALLRLRLLFSPLRPVVLAWDRLIGTRAFERQLKTGRLSNRPGPESGMGQ